MTGDEHTAEITMRKWITLAMITILGAATFALSLAAEEKFQKLTGAQIRAKFAGMELTDEVHWSDLYEWNGTVLSSSMGRKRTGKWRVEKDQLCVEFEHEFEKCYEVRLSGKKVELRGEGLLPSDGVLEQPAGRR
jgi:hypothetical protein